MFIMSNMYVQSTCASHIVVIKLNVSLWHELEYEKVPLSCIQV